MALWQADWTYHRSSSPPDRDYWACSEVWENLSGFLLLFSNALEISFAKRENHWTGTSQKVLVWIMTLFIYNYQNSDTWSRKEFSHFAAKVKENFVEKSIPKKSQKPIKTFHVKFFKLLFFFLLKCVYIGSVSFYSNCFMRVRISSFSILPYINQ